MSEDRFTEMIQVRITPSMKSRLERAAEREHTSVGHIVRSAIDGWFLGAADPETIADIVSGITRQLGEAMRVKGRKQAQT